MSVIIIIGKHSCQSFLLSFILCLFFWTTPLFNLLFSIVFSPSYGYLVWGWVWKLDPMILSQPLDVISTEYLFQFNPSNKLCNSYARVNVLNTNSVGSLMLWICHVTTWREKHGHLHNHTLMLTSWSNKYNAWECEVW